MGKYSWLHMSDLHIGDKTNPWMDKAIRAKLVSFLKKHDKLDFIVITGDLINRGDFSNNEEDEEAYENMKDFSAFISNIMPYCDVLFITVGNHDYHRNDDRLETLRKWLCLPGDKQSSQEKRYTVRLKKDFDTTNRQFYLSLKDVLNEESVETLKLSQTQVVNKINGLNIVLLNTSVYSGMPVLDNESNIIYNESGHAKINDDGRIHISADMQPDPALIDEDYHTVVFGHHPYEMMDKSSQKWMREFFKCYRDAQYFCGHAHSFGVDAPERIIEHTTAGLFIDNEDYNEPTFGYHKTSSDPKSLVVSEYYKFDDGNWKLISDNIKRNTFQQLQHVINMSGLDNSSLDSILKHICDMNGSDVEAVRTKGMAINVVHTRQFFCYQACSADYPVKVVADYIGLTPDRVKRNAKSVQTEVGLQNDSNSGNPIR